MAEGQIGVTSRYIRQSVLYMIVIYVVLWLGFSQKRKKFSQRKEPVPFFTRQSTTDNGGVASKQAATQFCFIYIYIDVGLRSHQQSPNYRSQCPDSATPSFIHGCVSSFCCQLLQGRGITNNSACSLPANFVRSFPNTKSGLIQGMDPADRVSQSIEVVEVSATALC